MAHTPGPWNCHNTNYLGLSGGIIRDDSNDPVADCRYSEVAERDRKTPETINANALLIAAAPELLDAAKDVIEYRKKEYLDNTIEPYSLLVAAIAKAEER